MLHKLATVYKLFLLETKTSEKHRELFLEILASDPIFSSCESPEKTECIVTVLTQPMRVLRELRDLNLTNTVLVIQLEHLKEALADFVRLGALESTHAWMTYQPVPSSSLSLQETVNAAIANVEHKHMLVDSHDHTPGRKQLNAIVNVNAHAHDRDLHDPSTYAEPLPVFVHEETEEFQQSGRKNVHEVFPKYSCQRYSPLISPNEALISEMSSIKLARTLQEDKIGIRAYATVIASLKALPHRIRSPLEVEHLEGCGKKIVSMIREFLETGQIKEVRDIWSDEEYRIKFSFWQVHGVGGSTAREWYNKGYRDINDAIQDDWYELPRAVQIGLKYYDDFLIPLHREEVQLHANMVEQVANSITGGGVHCTICGGYRRGKPMSGDIDIVLSHERIYGYGNLLMPLLESLQNLGHIETVITSSQDLGHARPAVKEVSVALVVLRVTLEGRTCFRRLDIIVAHPDLYICAIVGWSGATTFERDLRIFISKSKGWKFDSTGLSDEVTRSRISSPTFEWRANRDVEELERNFFSFVGLDYISPTLRNTG